jgi:hypothetical protein
MTPKKIPPFVDLPAGIFGFEDDEPALISGDENFRVADEVDWDFI